MTNWPAPSHDTLKAKVARLRSPGYSACLRCGMPWRFVEGHQTPYGNGSTCFPLCTTCWTLLAHPEARIGYYETLIALWSQEGTPKDAEARHAIHEAVAAGL